jgi:hypothetical protein
LAKFCVLVVAVAADDDQGVEIFFENILAREIF